MAKKKDTITAKELDRRFDGGEDISAFLVCNRSRSRERFAVQVAISKSRFLSFSEILKCAP